MRVIAVLAIATQVGCTGVCKGPGCEDSWDEARLSVLRSLAPGETSLDEVVAGEWVGGETEGSDWVATFGGPSVILGQPEAGRVLILPDRTDAGPVRNPRAEFTGLGTEFGAALSVVRGASDVNEYDLWISAPAWNFDRGAVYRFDAAHEHEGRDASDADLTLRSGTPADRLGEMLTPCADLDDDKIADLAIYAPFFAAPPDWNVSTSEGIEPLAGAVFLVLSADLPGGGVHDVWDVARVYWGETEGEGAGSAIACDRDLDGDNVIDVIIGAPWYEGTRGRIYRLPGGEAPSGRLDLRATATDGPSDHDWFGAALTTFALGGGPALAVGAPGFSDGRGRVHVFPGEELINNVEPRATAIFVQDEGHEYADHFGRTLASGQLVGTVQDGIPVSDKADDLVVGAPDFREGRNGYDTGRVWIWSGATSASWERGTPTSTADVLIMGNHPFERVGRNMSVGSPEGDDEAELLLPTRDAGG